jgi:hypothetical protein
MDFEHAAPSVVRSVRQLDLLNSWFHAIPPGGQLPRLANYRPSRITDELVNMMAFDVIGDGDDPRYLIVHEGERLTVAYGNDYPERDLDATRFLDAAIGPRRYELVVPAYRACIRARRPTYTVGLVKDADGREVAYERLLLPFSNVQRVEHIIGSYIAISTEGRFQVRNLMSIDVEIPVSVVRAIIGPPSPPAPRSAQDGDVVEA